MPGLKHNPNRDYPEVSESAYIDQDAVIIGKVVIGEGVYVGPGVVIRADEPNSEILIKDGCNIQDRVVIHCLENSAVFVGRNVSLAHGCIIHGPCKIGEGSFVGFGSVIFKATLGKGVVIKHLCCIQDTKVPENRLVHSGSVIGSMEDVSDLREVDEAVRHFAENVISVNKNLAQGYQAE